MGLSDDGPHTPSIIISMEEDPPSVILTNNCEVSISSAANTFKTTPAMPNASQSF